MHRSVPHILRVVQAAEAKGRDTVNVSPNGFKLLRRVYGEKGFTEISPGRFRIHFLTERLRKKAKKEQELRQRLAKEAREKSLDDAEVTRIGPVTVVKRHGKYRVSIDHTYNGDE